MVRVGALSLAGVVMATSVFAVCNPLVTPRTTSRLGITACNVNECWSDGCADASIDGFDAIMCIDQGTGAKKCALWDGGGAVFNVKAYGAVGNGSTDDTAAIQAALDAGGIGSHIIFPKPSSSYKITATLLYYNGQFLEGVASGSGDSQAATTGAILTPSSGITAFQSKLRASAREDNARFSGLAIRLVGTNAVGIDLTRVNYATIDHVVIWGDRSAGQIGILIAADVIAQSGGIGTRVSESDIDSCDYGIVLQSTANANTIGPSNHILRNRTAGVSVRGQCNGGTCGVSDVCEITATDGYHKGCDSCTGTSCSANITGLVFDTRIFKNTIESNGNQIVDLGRATVVDGNYFERSKLGNCSTTTTTACQADAECPGGETCINATNILVKGFNTTIHDNHHAFVSTSVTQPTQDGIQIRGQTGANVNRVTIAGEKFKGVSSAVGTAIIERSAGTAITVERNLFETLLAKVAPAAVSSGLRWIDLTEGVTFSELTGTFANGSELYCTDCTTDTTCANGGSGAFAQRTAGSWRCGGVPGGATVNLTQMIVPDNLIATANPAGKTAVLPANGARCAPFIAPYTMTGVTKVAFQVTDLGGTCGMCIYNASGGALVVTTGGVDCTTTGVKSSPANFSITPSNFSLSAGTQYIICWTSTSTTTQFKATSLGASMDLLLNAFVVRSGSAATTIGGACNATTGTITGAAVIPASLLLSLE